MENKKVKINKTPIFVVAPKDRKIAVGEYSYSNDIPEVKTITVRLKKPKKTNKLSKSYIDEYFEFELVNIITLLMERDYIEDALKLVQIYFSRFSNLEKKMITLNILEATNQYVIPTNLLPESYYDFLASDDSNDILF